MKVYIVRHGKADQNSPSGRDEDRQLKLRGESQACHLAAHFSAPDRRPALILASRFDRAFDTARMIQKAVACPLYTAPELESGRAPSDAVSLLAQHAADPLMLVGHNPQLSELIWILKHGTPAEDAGLRTGEAVILEIDHGDPVGSGHELGRVRLDEED